MLSVDSAPYALLQSALKKERLYVAEESRAVLALYGDINSSSVRSHVTAAMTSSVV